MNLKNISIIFRAFSDETRLRMLHLLSNGELCVCDVMSVLKEPQSKISRHFSYLRRAGLVTGRKEGLWMYYQLSQEGSKAFRTALQGLCGKTSQVKELRRDIGQLKHQKLKRAACCG